MPDLAPDFAASTIAGELAVAEEALGDGPAVVFGSSLGGWLAALLAARRPAAVHALVLYAPAFGFARRFAERMGTEAMARWRASGTHPVHHYGVGRAVPLGVQFLDDAARWAASPDPACPALVHAGRFDDIVPLDAVAAWAAARPGRELVVWDAGHELLEVQEAMWERTRAWLEAAGAIRPPP